MDDDHRSPLVAKLTEQLEDRGLGPRVDAREGLIHHHHRRLLGERTGEEDPLPLTAGEVTDLTARHRGHPDALETFGDDPLITAPDAAKPSGLAVATHLDDLAHGDREVPVDRVTLRDVGDAIEDLPGRMPLDEALAGVGREQPERGSKQRRLPGPVGPDDRRKPPCREGRIHVPKDRLAGVADGQPPDLERGRTRCREPIGAHEPSPEAIASALWRTAPA